MRGPLLPRRFPPPEPPPRHGWRDPLLGAAALFALLVLLYWPATSFRLLAFDDVYYTVGNDLVARGFDGKAVLRAFAEVPDRNLYIPLAHLSLMADVELFGMSPRGFHLTNVLLHGANMALLSLLLWRLTGSPWKALFAAALVGLHPMRAESVAWVTERKGLLSSLFLLLAVACHLRHVRSGGKGWYALLLAFFALALLSKPTAMVLPVLLLLLDAWPLGRLRAEGEEGGAPRGRLAALLVEKAPLLALSVLAGLLTAHLQANGSLHPGVPLVERLGHALAAPFVYLYQAAWPPSLAFRFFDTPWERFSGSLPWAAAATAAVTLLALRQGERRPWLLFGWGWYVLFLLPHGGLLPSGAQWISDRFTYLPHVGVAVAVAWGAADAVPAGPLRGRALPAAGLALLLLLGASARDRMWAWRDGAELFGRGLPENGDDASFRTQLVAELLALGRVEEARAANGPLLPLALRPGLTGSRIRLHHVQVLEGTGDREGAVAAAREYLAADPSAWKMRLLLADALLAGDRHAEAEGEYRILLASSPPLPPYERALSLEGLGIALAETGRGEEALAAYGEGLRWNPASVPIRYNAALLLARRGDRGAAAALLDEALRLEPGNERVAREREGLR